MSTDTSQLCLYRDVSSDTLCQLGLYGGRPSLKLCQACVSAGENTPATVAALQAQATRSHPPSVPRVSGCCDRADQG